MLDDIRYDLLSSGIFEAHALRLRLQGLAVVPAKPKQKAPLAVGYSARTLAYSERAIYQFALQEPEANILYQPGLSRPADNNEYRLVVLDGDDARAVKEIEDRFGPAPGTLTRRGRHFIYRVHWTEVEELTRLAKIAGESLRKFGLNVDIKHGTNVVVAAPSIHPEGDYRYKWDGPDVHNGVFGGDFLASAPQLSLSVLADTVKVVSGIIAVDGTPVTEHPHPHTGFCESWLDDNEPETQTTDERIKAISDYVQTSRTARQLSSNKEHRAVSRKLMLNDHLVSEVSGCPGSERLIEIARHYNREQFDGTEKSALDDRDVEIVAMRLWIEHMKNPFDKWKGGPAVVKIVEREWATGYPSHISPRRRAMATVLLLHLRSKHGSEPRKAFQITPQSNRGMGGMVGANVLDGWNRKNYREARDDLLEAGIITQTQEYKGSERPALYKLQPMLSEGSM